ncbi:MAG: phage portal protein, partial [Pseudomonadota bacterium]
MPLFGGRLAQFWAGRTTTPAESKASAVGSMVAINGLGQPVWAPRDYAAFAREGYMANAIVYRSVRMISEAAASLPLLLYRGDEEVFEHPLLNLLARPNREQTQADFFEAWYGFLLVSGNTYAEAVQTGGSVRELHILRPDRMTVVPAHDGWPEAYEYSVGGEKLRFDVGEDDEQRPILHVRHFHPLDDHYGLSPIEAAASAIDIHNETAKWNKALLDNAARPCGALVYAAREGQLTEDQYERLKDELAEGFQGARNA